MKKRMSKLAKDTLKEMAKDPPHVCPGPVEKVVYRVPKWYHVIDILVFSTIASLAWHFYSRPLIDKPYPVYHTVYVPTPDPSCQTTLAECREDYKAQRATIRVLRDR